MLKKTKRAFITLASAAVIAATIGWSTTASASEPFIAEIKMFAGNFAPRDYAFCDGQLLQISQNTALYSLVGTTYGGDGRTTFALPDLRGRVAIHPGNGPGLSPYYLGQRGGEEKHMLTVNELPSHTHAARGTDDAGNEETPGGHVWAKKSRADDYSNTSGPFVDMNPDAIGATGGGLPANNIQPYLSVNFIIALQGVYPSRS